MSPLLVRQKTHHVVFVRKPEFGVKDHAGEYLSRDKREDTNQEYKRKTCTTEGGSVLPNH
jgi:hypothetical protein